MENSKKLEYYDELAKGIEGTSMARASLAAVKLESFDQVKGMARGILEGFESAGPRTKECGITKQLFLLLIEPRHLTLSRNAVGY